MATKTATSRVEYIEDLRRADGDGDGLPSWGFRIWTMLIVVCAAFSLDALDNIMVGIAVPPIQADLGMSTSQVQWVVSAYVLGFGGFLLLGGRMSDLLGRRRIFIIGAVLFGVGTLAGGLATHGLIVIAARFVMGIGAAFSAPAALAIIVSTFPEGPHRNRALGIYTGCGALGYSTGVIAGGLLTQASWRWTFLAPVPVALVIIIGGLLLVQRDRPSEAGRGRGFDFGGAVTVTLGMLLLVYAIVEAPESGWNSARTLATAGAGAALLVLFWIIERGHSRPLLPPRLLRNGTLLGASLVAAAILGTYMSFQFIGGLYLQSFRGWSPLEMAFAFLPIGILIATLGPQMGKLVNRFGAHWMIFAGFVAYTASYVLFLGIGDDSPYLTAILPSIVLIGIAFPFSFPPANALAVSRVDESEHGAAAGILQTGYQVGAAIVLALTTAAMAANHAGGDGPPTLDGYRQGLYIVIAISAITMVATLVAAVRNHRAGRT
ncbi:MFS transporter [Glycomyces xiaoerkulensis]|uniref:MFS transporter n=1 Tax=Glycomyces xiaoerkulensis TaxID=2038139 RepID=UPI000C2615C7|nr:MFS transporter [Glycomyces xiaoerkulensis]